MLACFRVSNRDSPSSPTSHDNTHSNFGARSSFEPEPIFSSSTGRDNDLCDSISFPSGRQARDSPGRSTAFRVFLAEQDYGSLEKLITVPSSPSLVFRVGKDFFPPP